MRARWTHQTRAFLLRRTWNLVLNILFLDNRQSCLLCQRPLYGVDVGSKPTVAKADTVSGVCLFCFQDAKPSTQSYRLRNIRIRAADKTAPTITVPVISARRYEGVVRNAIRQWKYDGAIDLTTWFAGWVANSYTSWRVEQGKHEGDAELLQDMRIVPVPTSEDRMRKRGYDHVGLLVTELSYLLHMNVTPVLERRVLPNEKFTQSQTAKNAKERLSGLKGAYHLRKGADVRGTHVLLVDDIVTTGATLFTCAKTLLKGGAESVTCLVLADVE